ncbi:MAG: alpha/beta hydrolase [Planctomycetota bacterium]|jgi:pimeloyl-ACP methyl ester carboxylesterase
MSNKHNLHKAVRFAAIVAVCLLVVRMTGCAERLFYYPQPGATPVEAPAPTIVHVHGNAGNIESHRWFTQHLPPAGFNVFLFDYRGYGRSEGRATKRGPLMADTRAAIDAMLARPDVEHLGVYGQSLGGAIAINVAADRPEIGAIVLESPVSSWRDVAANAVGGDPPNWLGRALAWLLISDGDRPLDAIGRIAAPVLILHGDADSIVPVSHGRRLAQAAPGARLIELPGGEHNSLRDTHPEVDEITIAFFQEHLTAEDG